MNILHIFNEIKPSGAEMMLLFANKGLESNEITSVAVSTGKYAGDFAAEFEKNNIRVHHIPIFKNLNSWITFIAFVKDYEFDCLHIHTERNNLIYCLITKILRPKISIVRTIHAVFEFSGILRIRKTIERWLTRILGVRQLAISKSVLENEQKRFFNSTRLFRNWYDDTIFCKPTPAQRISARHELGITPEQIVLVSVGNCSPIKNHCTIIKSLVYLNTNYIYLHVGKEHSNNSERVLVHDYELSERVQFIGAVSPPVKILWAADIFVMPSLSEGFGNAALEALAVGLPCVLSNVGGLAEFKDYSSVINYTTNPLDERMLSELVFDLLNKQPEGSHASILNEFGLSSRLKDIIELYKKGD